MGALKLGRGKGAVLNYLFSLIKLLSQVTVKNPIKTELGLDWIEPRQVRRSSFRSMKQLGVL